MPCLSRGQSKKLPNIGADRCGQARHHKSTVVQLTYTAVTVKPAAETAAKRTMWREDQILHNPQTGVGF